MTHLHSLLLQYWEKGSVPQNMNDPSTVTVSKYKGDCHDCNNYHGTSLLSTVGKVFALVVPQEITVTR